MERRGFLGRLLGGVLAAIGVVKLAPKVQGQLLWHLDSKFLKKPKRERVFFKGVELIEDEYEPLKYDPNYSYVQVNGFRGREASLIVDQFGRAQRTMVRILDKEIFPSA